MIRSESQVCSNSWAGVRSDTSLRLVLLLRCRSSRLKSMTEWERNVSVCLRGTYADTAAGCHGVICPRRDWLRSNRALKLLWRFEAVDFPMLSTSFSNLLCSKSRGEICHNGYWSKVIPLVALFWLSSRLLQHINMIHPYVKLKPEARVPALHRIQRSYWLGYARTAWEKLSPWDITRSKVLTSSSIATIETATSQSESML